MVQDVKPGGIFLINCQWDFEELNKHLHADAKRYIAKNNVQLYTINAIDLAVKVGMGKRTNTILQAAFFALANVLPKDEAVKYMKDAAEHSYMKKGMDVVQKNWDAIDAGAGALVKIDVPADWANATEEAHVEHLEGPEKTVAMVRNIMEPVGRMNGDSLPVSAFVDYADGTFQQGAAAYEKRGVSVTVPEWTAETCAQCNQCAYVCPHATIRPYTLNAEEAAAAPEGTKMVDHKMSKGKYKYALAVSPLDCMGCSVCVSVCPTKSLKMVGQESQLGEQKVFDYMVKEVTVKSDVAGTDNVIKSQYLKPYLEFSGSCAGCAETSYARLVTQLFGNRMYVSNATGCSSIWGGPAATSPYCMDKNGKGVAWANSLFEDNAEHGYGMYLGQKVLREKYIEAVKELIAVPYVDEDIAAAGKEFLDTVNDGEKNSAAAEKLIAAINANPSVPTCECDACKLARKVLEEQELPRQEVRLDLRRRRLGVRHRLRRSGPRPGLRRRRQRVRVQHRGVLQHRRTGLQGFQHRPGRAVRGGRQGDQEQVSRRDRHDLRLRLRRPGRYGREHERRRSRPSRKPRRVTARPSSSATPPARCTPSRAAWPTASLR